MANRLIADVTATLQKVIMPFVQDNFDKSTILLDQVKRNKGVTYMNDNFYAPIRTGRHGGITNLANDGNSLVQSSAKTGQASVGVKILTGTFKISKLVLDATKTNKGAVKNELTLQAESLLDDFSKNVNRQYYSDGVGVISEVSGTSDAATINLQNISSSLDDGRSVDWYGSVNGDISATEYIHVDQVLGFGTAGADLGTVSSIVDGTTIVVTGSPAHAANDAVYIVDGSGEGAGTSEIQGMRAALSSTTGTTTYAGVARSTQGWTPQLGTVSEALTLSPMEDKYLAAKKFAQKTDRYAIFMNKTLYKKYGDILTSMRRHANETDLLGGWTGLEFAAGAGKVGVFLDYDVPDGEVLIVNLDTWVVCQVSDMSFTDGDSEGSIIRSRGTILYEVPVVWFTNLLCVAPGANGRLTQKTD